MMFSNYYKYNFVENTIRTANNLQRGKHCMIDSGSSITILPNGKISNCEHFTDKNLFINKKAFQKTPEGLRE